jgi:AcrR family transcriptional regulator
MNEQLRHQAAVAADDDNAEVNGEVNGHHAAEQDAAHREGAVDAHHVDAHHVDAHHVDAHHEGAHQEGAHHEGRRHGDTRARIQQVALELFAEQGYDKTSLREIAERLDVTKAALYYHFKSKEDIVRSLVEDYFGQIDALIVWAKTQPRTPAVRREVLGRYVRIVADGSDVFRMLHHNQAAMNSLAAGKERGEVFKERMTGLVEALTEPGASMEGRLRATMLLGGVSVGWMLFTDQVADREKLRAAVLGIATDLAEDA